MESQNTKQEDQFFLTPQHPCSYLNRFDAQTLFYDPRIVVSESTYERLTKSGFRRSGGHLYRPHCKLCNGCVPIRIPVANFPMRRSHRRVINKNRDLTINIEEASFNSRFYDLYQRYINVKHVDGDMFPPSIDQYKTFLLSPWANSIFISSYSGKKLISVAVTDKQKEGLSAIYTFYDPNESRRSLGTFNILNQIRIASELDLEYLYLGYWIANNEKMHYKINFKPLELYTNSQWTKIGFV